MQPTGTRCSTKTLDAAPMPAVGPAVNCCSLAEEELLINNVFKECLQRSFAGKTPPTRRERTDSLRSPPRRIIQGQQEKPRQQEQMGPRGGACSFPSSFRVPPGGPLASQASSFRATTYPSVAPVWCDQPYITWPHRTSPALYRHEKADGATQVLE